MTRPRPPIDSSGEDPGRPQRPRPDVPQVRPFVRTGELLPFAAELTEKELWPPNRVEPPRTDAPTATPFLVIKAEPNDRGARPLPGPEALRSVGVQIVDATGTPVQAAQSGGTYRLACEVTNRGATASYAGLADFFVQPSPTLDAAVGKPAAALPAQGRTGFLAPPGQAVTVESPNQWRPQTVSEAAASVLVHAYDPLLDPLTAPFNSRHDRHVGRLDTSPDFAGAWNGTKRLVGDSSGTTFLYRVIISQSGLAVTVAFYDQVGGVLPSVPQNTMSGTIVAHQIQLTLTDNIRFDHWTLTLPTPGLLHVEQHKAFNTPGDTRPDQDLVADLARM